jgi:putative membrane protein
MSIKFLATAIVTGLLLNGAVGPTPAVAQGSALAGDSTFIQSAASFGLLQVQLGKMAQEKGSSPAVRDFGQRMVADYTKANEEFAAGAKQAAFPSPALTRQHRKLLERFSQLGRSSFDKSYMAEMVNQQDQVLRLFQQEADKGKVASLKQLASKMLPTIQGHLALAKETAGSVGADVTASTSGARQGS